MAPGTAPSMTDDPPETAPETVRSALEAAGWRCTRQRVAVFERLAEAAREGVHPSAEEVYQAVRPAIPGLSLATVYKALEALVASKLVAKLPPGDDGMARYDARGEHHYHLRCARTGAVQDLPTPFDPDLPAKLDPGLATILRERGFRLTGYRLELVGYFDDPSAAS